MQQMEDTLMRVSLNGRVIFPFLKYRAKKS